MSGREAYFQRITVAHRELSTDNLAAALRALEECPEDLRGWEWHYLMRLCQVEPLVLRDTTEVNGVAFSPDGERLASAGEDGTVKIWNSRTGQVIQEFPAHDERGVQRRVPPRRQAPGLRRRGSAGEGLGLDDRPAGVRGSVRRRSQVRDGVYRGVQSPDGRHLAAGSDGAVRVWDWKNRPTPVHTFPGPEYHSIRVAFSRDGRRLATGGTWEQGLKLWDAETGAAAPHLPRASPSRHRAGVQPGRRAAGHGQLRPERETVGYDDRRAPPHPPAYRTRPGRRLQPGRPAPRLGRRGQDGARLGRGDRPGGARPARTHRQVRVRGVQPGRPAPRLGQQGRDHPRLGRDPAAGGRGPGNPDLHPARR